MSSADRAAAAVRLANSRECLLVLRDAAEPMTVGELAIRTGLSRPTVDAVLADLVDSGAVTSRSPAEAGTPGRPARRFAFDPGAGLVVGVDVGVHQLRCRVADASGRVLLQRSEPAIMDGTDRITNLARTVEDLVAAAVDDHVGAPAGGTARPAAVGIAVPGILGRDDRVVQSLAIPEWIGVDLQARLSDRLGCPVTVENDIKAAAYAEHHVAAVADNLIFLQIGHRISVAVIVAGKILQGSHRVAGELGSQRGMRWTSSSRRGDLLWSTGHDAEPLFARAAAGDHAARDEIEQFCAEIAPTISTLLLAVDPEVVIVGGGLSRSGPTLLDPLRRQVHRLLMTPEKPEFRSARLTTDGAVIGALGHAFEHSSAAVVGIPGVPPPWNRLHDRERPSDPATARTEESVPA